MHMELSVIITAVGVLVALTNIITQVLKKATWDKMPTNVVALIVSVTLTLAAGIAYCQIEGVALSWYVIIALIVAGFMEAALKYAADVKHEQKDFLAEQGIHNLFDE